MTSPTPSSASQDPATLDYTMWAVARRPRWIAALVLALAIAAAFALLSQWQLARSVTDGTVIERATETVVPLSSIAEPNAPVTSTASGQLVTVEGEFAAGDFVVLSGRSNGGDPGYWVVGNFLTQAPGGTERPSIAVAVGWAATKQGAEAAITELDAAAAGDSAGVAAISGRYLATEPPNDDDFENGVQSSVSVSALVNQWAAAPQGVYGGYLSLTDATAGLDDIYAPVPSTEVSLNWLNIFYAVEWVVFAGFAIFLWFRLVRDAWEREREEADELTELN